MAQDLNSVVLIGRLTQDVGADERSFQYVGNNFAKATLSIAVNSSKKQNEQYVDVANFFNVTLWGKQAESLKPYLKKGTQVCIQGHLQQDRWEKDGQKHSAISIIADHVQLLGSKPQNSNNGNSNGYSGGYQQSAPAQSSFDPTAGFPEDYPSNIPF